MIKIEDIRKDSVLNCIVSGQSVKIASVDPIGDDALSVLYKNAHGNLGERMLFRGGRIESVPSCFEGVIL